MKAKSTSNVISRSAFFRRVALAAPLASFAGVFAEIGQPSAPAFGNPDLGNLRSFVELARSDLRTQKALIFAENMAFTNDQAVDFWPLHREYDQELNTLMDARYAAIVEFFQNQGSMTDAEASELAKRTFNLEEKRTELKRRYFKKFKTVIPALKAARFFQIENQINMAIDLQIAASLPLIK